MIVSLYKLIINSLSNVCYLKIFYYKINIKELLSRDRLKLIIKRQLTKLNVANGWLFYFLDEFFWLWNSYKNKNKFYLFEDLTLVCLSKLNNTINMEKADYFHEKYLFSIFWKKKYFKSHIYCFNFNTFY